MVKKKVTATKKATAEKGTVTRKAPARKRTAKGESYTCEVCGLVVTVDEVCGCVDVCDIICCGKPMKEKKPRAKASVKTAAKK